VLTMPDALHSEFYRDRALLADLMQPIFPPNPKR
jgi:hypothetical protein